MSICRFLLLISPLLLGLLIPFLLSYAHEQRAPGWMLRGWRRVLATIGALFVILVLCAVAGGEPFLPLLCALAFLLSLTVLLAAIFFFLASVGLPLSGCQIVLSLLVILMTATPFYFNPLLEATSGNAESVHACVAWATRLNPSLILGGSILDMDPLKAPTIYRFSLLSYYKVSYPSWWTVALAYLAISVLLIAGSGFLRRRRKNEEHGTLLSTNAVR